MTVDGLGLTYPQPGWVVLDAIRDRGLTGSVMLGGSPAVLVFADQGDIYWAEEVGAPSVGARLVDAGAIAAVQLERGAVRHDGVERLERLFERVPAIERDTVLVAVRALAEQSLVRIASQMLAGAVVEPYIHHASGIHLWNAKHPVARRNDTVRVATWSPPEPMTTEPAVVSAAAPPVSVVPEKPVTPAVPATSEVPDTPAIPDTPKEPEVPPAAPTRAPDDPDDFSLVWNDVPTPPGPAGASAASPRPTRPAAIEAPGGSAESMDSTLGDEFEVKWPGRPVETSESPASDSTLNSGAQSVDQTHGSVHVSRQQRAPAWSPIVDADVGHSDRLSPAQSLTDALGDLIGLVDRDLVAVRHEVDDFGDAEAELHPPHELMAVRRAIASADTGLLDARRRLIDHRLSDRSSRGSGSSSNDGAGTTELLDGGDQEDVAEESDDLDDDSPALRRFMGNLRRA